LDALKIVHGGGSKGSSGNRWFDKTIEVKTHLCRLKLLVFVAEGVGYSFFMLPACCGISIKSTESFHLKTYRRFFAYLPKYLSERMFQPRVVEKIK
jgi:hypothetical protein